MGPCGRMRGTAPPTAPCSCSDALCPSAGWAWPRVPSGLALSPQPYAPASFQPPMCPRRSGLGVLSANAGICCFNSGYT